MMKIRQIVLIDQEILSEGGRETATPARRIAACAVVSNPFVGVLLDDHIALVDLSVQIGAVLTEKALKALNGIEPCGYGKAALVGTAGDLEHGAAMIHVRLGLAMRRGVRGGPALIPGNAKVGGVGTPVDVILGGIEDAWNYDAMDTMQVTIPDAPKPDEILLIVAFLAGGRPNARIRGASQQQVAELVHSLRGGQ